MSSPSVLRRIAQSTGIVMASVLASRLLGFLRDWAVVRLIGSTAVTDAYYAAFTLPDFLNYLVASGSLSLIFIPVFTHYVAEEREDEAWHNFSTVVTFMGLLLITAVTAAEIFAPSLLRLIVPGFGAAERAQAIFLTRLMLPAQICFFMGSILSAVQYAKKQFVLPSLAPVIYNLGIISGGVLLASRIGITGFSVGVLAGAIVGNFLLQVYGAARAGARFHPNLHLRHPGFLMFLKMAVPIMLALSFVFMDDWIIRWFASYLPAASITWLTIAKRLMQVPLGVVGQAVGVASFPFLAQLYSEGKLEELNQTLNSTLKGLILMLLPISALSIAQSSPLVYLLYSHTKMHGPDLDATASLLAFFSFGMFAWGAQNILARGFYAARDTLTPAWVGTVFTFLALPLYWVLANRWQHVGLAIASSCGIIAYTAALFIILTNRTHNREAGALLLFFLKVAAASALAAGGAYAIMTWLQSHLAWKTAHGALFVLVLTSSFGFAMTAIFARLFAVSEVDHYFKKVQSLLRMRLPSQS